MSNVSLREAMEEEGESRDPFKLAVRFLAPCLAQFGFSTVPFHLRGRHTERQLPDMEQATKLSVVQHEHHGNMQRATTVYIDWLLQALPPEPDALRPFLRALRAQGQQRHVHDMVCVCCVYLDVHRHLSAVLAPKLLDGSVQLPVLLNLLTKLRLLDPERAPEILNVARDGDSEEVFARAVKFMLACLYSRQAKILHELHNADVSEIRTDPQISENESRPPSNGSDVSVDVDDIIAYVMQEVRSQDLNPVDPPSRMAESDDDVLTSLSSSAGEPDRWDPQVLAGMLHVRERWPELLNQALALVSKGERGWPYAQGPLDVHSLWEAARGLIQSGLRENRGDDIGENDDGDSEEESIDSGDTVRANNVIISNNNNSISSETTIPKVSRDNLLREEWTKNFVKNLPDVTADPYDDVSTSSVETNSRQRGRRVEDAGAGLSGVLREEEMRSLKAGPIQLRPYQDELLSAARKGQNVLIWLPTGTGKTYIVLKYAEEHLKAAPDRRVAFVVPKVRLARQQFERFLAYLPEFNPHLKCGETTGTSSGRQPLGEILKTSRVVVLTGQSLVEAVERNRVSLDQFSLLVLDECHHTRGGHPLRVLMNQYMEVKFQQPGARLPQVVGLTASPGVGKARGKEVEDAVKYLKQLCARLDVSNICSVRTHVEDLKRYVHEPVSEVKECVKRKVDKLKERLEQMMKIIEDSLLVDLEFEKYLNRLSPTDTSEGVMLKNLTAPAGHRGEDQYTQWLSNAEKTTKQVNVPKAFYALTAHIDLLRLCQRCLMLNEDCDSPGTLELLKEEVDALRQDKPPGPEDSPISVNEKLLDIFDEYTSDFSTQTPCLMQQCYSRDCQNPKLQHLESLLLNSPKNDPRTAAQNESGQEPGICESSSQTLLRQSADASTDLPKLEDVGHGEEMAECLPDAEHDPELMSTADSLDLCDAFSVTGSELDHLEHVRGMVFVRTLDLSKAMLRWMRRHPKLKHLNPDRITGVNASVKNGGMTKSEVTEVMSKFNSGAIKVVICTSAAEEGLDFKACNFVIRYLYEASMVSMIQIRGRARDENSKYSVLGNQNTRNKERENVESEAAMCEAVLCIQRTVDADPRAHWEAIQRMQREAWHNRWRKDVDERKRLQQRLEPGMYRLQCRKCRLPACTSEDIRILRKTNRVVIGAEFSNKYERRDYEPSERKAYDEKIPRTGKIHCKRCGSYWGILVRSVDDNIEFPVIPIKSFLVEDNKGDTTIKEKWSQAFEVPEISEEDLQRHSEPLLGPQDRLEGDLEPEETEDDQDRAPERGHLGEPVQDRRNGFEPEEPEVDQQRDPSRHVAAALGLQNPGDQAAEDLQLEDAERGDIPQALNDLNSLSLLPPHPEHPQAQPF